MERKLFELKILFSYYIYIKHMKIKKETIEHFRQNKNLITEDLLDELRKTNEGKQIALEMLDIDKDEELYYVDAFGNRISFNGNRKLKKPFTKFTLSDIHVKEIEKCSKSLTYFRDNYVKIKTPHGISFPDLREYQDKFLEEIDKDYDSYCVLFPRQSGKSITTAIYLTYKFIFGNDFNIGICANKGSMAREFLNNVKNIILELPIWLQQGIKVWNKGSIEGENGMRVLTDVPSGDAFRGFTIALLVIDESAYIPTTKWQEFMDGIMPSQSSLSWKKNILLSTANGMNHFYQIVKGARKRKELLELTQDEVDELNKDDVLEVKENHDKTYNITLNKPSNGYHLIEVDWREVPRYDAKGNIKDPEVFKQEIVDKYGIVYFNQAYANCVSSDVNITVKDTLTGNIKVIPIGSFYESYRKKKCN